MSSPVARKLAAADARRIAATKAAHAATVSRRQAAAGRRRLLMGILLLIAVVMVIIGAATPVSMWPALIPTLLVGGVGYAGYRSAQSARAADAKWEEELVQIQRPLAQRTQANSQRDATTDGQLRNTGRASLRMDVDPTSLFVEEEKTVEIVESTWTPVPVPAPTYTLKPAAPRRTVAAYEAPAQTETAEVTHASPEEKPQGVTQPEPTHVEPAVSETAAQDPAGHDPAAHDPARTVDVREVLARRRAAG